MSQETASAVIGNVFHDFSDGDNVCIAFQGGEPTLAGLDFFVSFVSMTEAVKGNVRVTYSLQTNAVLIDDRWCEFLKKYQFLVGVSLDGFKSVHDLNRVDPNGLGTYNTVMKSIQLLKTWGIDFNILMTLTSSLAKHPVQVWNSITANDFRYVQFTPCLAPLDGGSEDRFAITPKRFADFYIQIFRMWKKEFDQGNYYSIKLIDDLVNLIAAGEINACGLTGRCSPQIVVEADGSVYPCDFYTLDQWCTGNLSTAALADILKSPNYSEFLRRERQRKLCVSCGYRKICNGACERMQSGICYAENDMDCGYRTFLDAVADDLIEIARVEQQYRQQRHY